ncbi:MAG: SIS domain-containing protein [Anaerolineaceae bacterium]|nr:SIS domain-containing protein [Anaerolineaceae bacterium]
MNAANEYLHQSQMILQKIVDTQSDAIEKAAELCSQGIASDGLVHLFGTGHSRIFVEEMFPRHGSFPGFHPIVELSLTFHNLVVGSNGQRQAMYLEHVEGFGQVIMRNFVFSKPDCFLIYSNSGVNEVVIDVALEAKKQHMPVIAVISVEHCQATTALHSSGKKLLDIADILIDNCTPGGDALVKIPGLADPVGPGSTIGAAAVTNALKSLIAQKLTKLGKPPIVLTSSYFIGSEASKQRFDDCYDDYRNRVQKVYGPCDQ